MSGGAETPPGPEARGGSAPERDRTGGASEASRRPRVVMVVMNHITGDSRVQKAAESMAAAGWDVYLLGRSRSQVQETSTLGGATVIRVPTDVLVSTRRKQSWRRGIAGRVGFRTRDDELADRSEVAFRRADAAAETRWLADEAAGRGVFAGRRARIPRRAAIAVAVRRTAADVLVHRATHALRRKAARRHAQALAHPNAVAARLRGLVFGTVVRGGGWRRTLPHLVDWELAFGPVVDELAPDVIHAHDITTIGLAARAADRARVAGRPCRVVYDAHEWVAGVGAYSPDQRAAYLGLEDEYVRRVDAVVTVSEPIAELLRTTYGLTVLPEVVTNSPVAARARLGDPAMPSVRRVAGVADGVPLIVYSGWLAPERGVSTMVDALPHLPGVHAVVVASGRNAHVAALESRAAELGVADRLHIAPYVRPDEVVAYLSSADAGLITNLHEPNNELALNTKYREYLHARLPIVVSDLRTMGEYTRRRANGEVFRAGDAAALADAVRRVLAEPGRYRAAYADPELLAEHSWERQSAVLAEVYARVTGLSPAPIPDGCGFDPPGGEPASPRDKHSAEQMGAPPQHEVLGGHIHPDRNGPSLLIGPSNMAGQAWAWAEALSRHLPEVRTEVAALERPDSPLRFAADRRISAEQWQSGAWHVNERARITTLFTHVLLENGLAVTGARGGGRFLADARAFAEAGLRVGLIFHGSEIRDPRRHRTLPGGAPDLDSPFADPNDPATARLQERYDELAVELAEFDGPRFVSTLDLLDFAPGARWLPVTVDTEVWLPGPELFRGPRPVVLHAPSRGTVKGSAAADQAAARLAAEGLIEYRRIENVPPEEMPVLVREVDIVLDQFAVGGYGVLAAQAMSAARCVVGNVTPRVRARLLHALPIVQAASADVGEVLLELVKDRDRARAAASAGPAFVARHHDGTAAALALADFLEDESDSMVSFYTG